MEETTGTKDGWTRLSSLASTMRITYQNLVSVVPSVITSVNPV